MRPLEIEAWLFRLDRTEPSAPSLSEEEALRAADISDPLHRSRYERTRSAVRRVLAERLDLPPDQIALTRAAGGKPMLANRPGCEFSLSHSGAALVVATSGEPIGVDIETRGPRSDVLTLAGRFFSPEDCEMLRRAQGAPREEIFLRQWVAKEAALKAAGCGLAGGLREAACDCLDAEIRAVRWAAHHYSIQPFRLEDSTPGAIAWAGDRPAAIRWREPGELADRIAY
ncbi:MAG: 4'-phosphopantetheinyl transferase superfamily protein [Terrimicrobiaceae bacterium]|nr:4'-phosphopantetheinyl transferase superfamily protein [Terrimicrobiaceae bacterium]